MTSRGNISWRRTFSPTRSGIVGHQLTLLGRFLQTKVDTHSQFHEYIFIDGFPSNRVDSRRRSDNEANFDQDEIIQSTTVQLDQSFEGTVSIQIEYEFSNTLTAFEIAIPPNLSVSHVVGFKNEGDRCVWDGETELAEIQGVIQASNTAPGKYHFVGDGDWAIIQRPPLSISYQYIGNSPNISRHYSVRGDGITSSDGCVMYLGPHEEYTHQAADQNFRLAVPKPANLRENPLDILNSLGFASEQLEVGGRNQSVIAIAAPTGAAWSSRGVQSGANGFWAQDSCNLDNINNTWVHEYIHTRQEWDETSATKWLTEATTEYYAALLTYQQGNVPFSAFYDHISTSRDGGSVLVNPSQWTSNEAYYTKGRRVLAALDVEIRRNTDNEKTFQSVFFHLNKHNGALSHNDLVNAVNSEVDQDLEDWLDQYVRGSDLPNIPNQESLFQSDSTTPPASESGSDPGSEPETVVDCPLCGAEVPDSDKYCPECGQSIRENCPVCGTEVEGEIYCPECGSSPNEDCPLCGATRVGEERYCQKCGYEFE